MTWRVFAAAATGKSHLNTGMPCQDAFAYSVDDDLLIAAVCDGAGSQALSDKGARLVADAAVKFISRAVKGAGVQLWLDHAEAADGVAKALAAVRNELERASIESELPIDAYATTLVGVVADAGGGWFFHIGDGLAVAASAASQPPTISRPENGEYANETYFVTGERWFEHLRLTRIESMPTQVVLMSDGAASFAANRDGELFSPFMDPVIRFLAKSDAVAGPKALAGTLADPRTDSITGDDKTLLIALRDIE